MEELEVIKQKIRNGPLISSEIQKLLLFTQRVKHDAIAKTAWSSVCDIIWMQLQQEHDNFDDQLLLCTCFYTILPLTEEQDYYLRKIQNIIQNEHQLPGEGSALSVCLVYGMFQSSFLSRHGDVCSDEIGEVLQHIFHLLLPMAYSYSRYTFIVFKVISLFKKVINTCFEKFIYTSDNKIKLLNLVNHNWENPITGIRDINRIIFSTLISVLDSADVDSVIEEIQSFNWNKAKYLMLSEIIEFKSNVGLYLPHEDWIEGAISSLEKTGLVSAGADMYFSILKSLKSDEQWCTLFLEKIIDILIGKSKKAIQNFCNYWCLTTFRTFPSLIEIILNNILVGPQTEITYFSAICIWKQANRLGYFEKDWGHDTFRRIVQQGLENSDIQMRIFAFDILCVSKLNTMPSQMEYDLMINFLSNNINSDSTVLRLNMLSSLKSFLIRIHTAFASLHKQSKNTAIDGKLVQFCTQIQDLLVMSLTMRGNYQRKLTALKLCDVILKYFSEVPRKKQQNKTSYSVLDGLVEQGHWTLSQGNFVDKLMTLLPDPAEDIRDSTMHLLLEHYFNYLKRADILQKVTELAIEKIKSKFFYKISCGHTFIKLLLSVVVKEDQPEAMLKNVDDIFEYAFKEFVTEFEMKRDILQSIEAGKQLHSFMAILSDVLRACLKHTITVSTLDKTRMSLLLQYLEDISNQFVSEETSNADFSKISSIVEDTIMKSGIAKDGGDASKLSGIHQIVLNCMWLNVKETCVLASLLIKYDENPDVNLRCLHIITHVLETSRHKGAMEASGVALGQGIQHLTSLPKGSDRSRLPLTLLQAKLNNFIKDAADTASITRRGAGLSILVHRIVSSDAQKGKPLFHYFMKTLLASCSSIDDVPAILADNPDVDNEKDLPKAIYLHFLTRIINDSSLASDIMFYSASLAELAFNNLTSKHWQIRNAALQLYGALIPKLIGQNKQSGADDETIATVACDEFRTHSQRLWRHILSSLHQDTTEDPARNVLLHADLVPAVNLLASTAKRYNLQSDMQQHNDETTLFQDLLNLLSSPLHTVRRLAAKCIYNIFTFKDVHKFLMSKTVDITENSLHGTLMLAQHYHKNLSSHSIEEFTDLAQLFTKMFNRKKRSFACRLLFDDMFLRGDVGRLEKSFEELENNPHEPGVSNWMKVQIARNLRNCSSEQLPLVIKVIFKQRNYEEYYELLLEELKCQSKNYLEGLGHVAECLIENDEQFHSEVVWKILYKCSLNVKITNVCKAVKYFELNEIHFRTRYILPFLAKNVQADNDVLLKLSDVILRYSDSENVDYDMRFVAALSNNEFGNRFDKLNDNIKISAIKAAVVLLQDEDEDIRYLNIDFYRNITKCGHNVQPFICLNNIIQFEFLHSIFSCSESVDILCKDLLGLHSNSEASGKSDEYNPFSNDTNNIYKENEFTTLLIRNVQKRYNELQ